MEQMLLLSKLYPALLRNPVLILQNMEISSHPHLTDLGHRLLTAGWIQIDEETQRSAYDLSKIFEKQLEISKIKKHMILTKRLKKPLLLFADL